MKLLPLWVTWILMVTSVPFTTLSGALIVTDALSAKAVVAETTRKNSEATRVNRTFALATMFDPPLLWCCTNRFGGFIWELIPL